MKCSKCASDIAQDAQFCAKCGTKVSSDNSSADSGQAGPTKTTIENIADISAEKWKELSPKAKQAAVEAGEKASAMSKDIASELKQSGAALRQAIEENKGDGSQTKAQVIGKTATSFVGKLSGKQKAILAGAVALSVFLFAGLFGGDSDFDKVHNMMCKLQDMQRGKLSLKETEELAREMSTDDTKQRLQAKYKGREAEFEKKMLEVLSKKC